MLFSKPILNLDFDDIEEFCKRFNENLRVEYKSSFDDSVKRKLPNVLSSFANSYGGILIIGVNAPAGVPLGPFEGVVFPEREPGLTVQNICRERISPEIPLYTSLVASRVADKAFLVVQVNESQKAPHSIENSTQVYVRTDGGTERTTLADMMRIERMLARRQEVSRRWEESYAESLSLAKAVGIAFDVPHLELRLGPQYPSEVVITRDEVSQFLSDHNRRQRVGFLQQEVLRHPEGAFLARHESSVRYFNVSEIGTVHYLEPLEFVPQKNLGSPDATNFWWITASILRIIAVVADLMNTHGITCDWRIEAKFVNIAGIPFSTGPSMYNLEIRSAVFPIIPSSLI